MKKIIQNTFNFVLAIILMVSTTGMTIYKLHCDCLHHNHVSILIEPDGCHSHEHHDCSTPHDCNCNQIHHNHDYSSSSCDTKETFFVKLESVFISSNSNIQDEIIEIKSIELILPILLNIEIESFQKELNSEYLESPPPNIESGKEIITNHHQFKFDHIA